MQNGAFHNFLRHNKAMPIIRVLSFAVFAMFFCCRPLSAAEIHPVVEFAADEADILASITWTIPADYHAYAHTPGDAGRPTSLEFEVAGLGSMPVWYPAGFMQRDIYDPDATVYTWQGDVTLFAMLPKDAAGKRWEAELSMLLCSNRNCVPLKKSFSGKVPAKPQHLDLATFKSMGQQAMAQMKTAASDAQGAGSLEEGAPPPPIGAAAEQGAARAGPARDKKKPQPIPELDAFDLDLSPQYIGAALEVYGLGKALLLGLLAGLLLNAMPCVLPVLTFKISGLLLMAGVSDRQKVHNLREHNLCFAAGIMTLFTILALVFGLFDLMWGQLYQSHAFLLCMLLLVFLMGLSMLGVFHLPAMDLRLDAKNSNPRLCSYLTGLVSTFLATPCSGPLLGGVLAWAFTQPLPVLMVVFWAVGLGMSLPYLVICVDPKMANILPRPGAWMLVFEQVLGFMLLGTALYLLSILPVALHFKALCALLACAICAWLWGKFCGYDAPVLRRRICGILFVGFICASFFWILAPAEKTPAWQAFTVKKFMADLGSKPMLVEFTADWCPNCKFVEASALTAKNLAALSSRYNPVLMRVDLTDPNPYAEKLLEMLGSKSIPLTALFPQGPDSLKPLVLRDIYGSDSLFDSAKKAFGKKPG